MTLDVSDLSPTITPKSDQLNAEQLLGGPLTIRVTEVKIGATEEQPVIVHYEGENGRPYKPCKTMRKLLVFAWGKDGRRWVGRSMTLYNEPAVKFGGQEVGGIRISHLSNIETDLNVALTSTRGKKALHTIKILSVPDAIKSAETMDALKTAFGAAYKAAADAAERSILKAGYDARAAELGAAMAKAA